jgi:aryl-alcohol dehydrogenase-like predicted oxidoreductase
MSRTTDDDRRTEHRISESADKLTLTTKVKRGEGTRDEDRIKIKAKGNDPDEVVEKLEQTVANLQTTTDDLRNLRAGDDDD